MCSFLFIGLMKLAKAIKFINLSIHCITSKDIVDWQNIACLSSMLLGVQLSVYWGAACASAPLVGISRPLMTKWCWQGPPPAPVGVGTGQAHMLTWGESFSVDRVDCRAE